MESFFGTLSDQLFAQLENREQLTLNFYGESTLFTRFNKSKVRQVSQIDQIDLSLIYTNGGIELSHELSLQGELAQDTDQCLSLLKQLRSLTENLAPVAFAMDVENHGQSSTVHAGNLPDIEHWLSAIEMSASDVDLAGVLTSGTNYQGNANSLGQRHWFETRSFYLDFSLYTEKEKAVKSAYCGTEFNRNEFIQILEQAKAQLAYMSIDNKIIEPGQYRCYFAPAAVNELLQTFNWSGASQSALKRGNSPLLPLEKDGLKLSEQFTLTEDFSLALHPQFNEAGETAADRLEIFHKGSLRHLLTSSKTAKEFDLDSNFSNDSECLRSPVIDTGNLAKDDILTQLGTGLYISNLHYLNWSDSKKGRITGMTRFACFWVENGKIVAPIKDLRFDETLYNFWGKHLIAVTDFSEIQVNTDTYYKRAIGGSRCPGMLVDHFNFTL